jgi:23S rRNA (adenine2030-N6)-methyltransferase
MLSYQHAYHAGNPADVHKHVALMLLLRTFQRKDSPFCYVDSHAGRGLYDLESEAARTTRESDRGILRLAEAEEPPPCVREYLDLVASFNAAGRLRYYPGSAAIGRALLREQDRAILLELHRQELAALRESVGRDRRISVHERDCYEGLPALLPPPLRRGMVLMDPSYEVKREYEEIAGLLGKALARFANGVYLLWYPLLPEARHRRLVRRMTDLAPPKTLTSEYRFSAKAAGLQGSGLVVVNAPWQFEEALAATMQYIVAALDSDGETRHEQRWLGIGAGAMP